MTRVLTGLALMLTPVAVFSAAWLSVAGRGSRIAGWCRPLTRALARLAGRRPRRPQPASPIGAYPVADPFETLRVQLRLSALQTESRHLRVNADRFSRAVKVRAVSIAYDDLLAEAMTLAEVPVQRQHGEDRRVGRLREETELAERGWIW